MNAQRGTGDQRRDWGRWLSDTAGDVARGDVRAMAAHMTDGIPSMGAVRDPVDLFRAMFETWFSMAEAVMADTWGIARQTGQTVAGAAQGSRDETLSLRASPSGSARGKLYLKNHSSTQLADVGFRCTVLESAKGDRLDPASVSFDPATLPKVLPGANLEVVVTITVPAAAAPGIYHGLVLVEPIAETCRPIRVQVVAA